MNKELLAKFLQKRDEIRNNNPNKQESSGNGGIRWYTLPAEGHAKLRILPPVHGASIPGKVVVKHGNLPGDKKKLHCLRDQKLDCPICNTLEAYSSRISIKDYAPRASSFMNVLVLEDAQAKNPIESGKPYILTSSDYNLFWLVEKIMNPEIGDITDKDNGHSVVFRRKTKFGAFEREISLKSTPISSTPEGTEAILKEAYDLERVFKAPDDSVVQSVGLAATELAAFLEEKIKLRDSQITHAPNGGVETHMPPQTTNTATTNSTPETATATNTGASTAPTGVPSGAPACFSKEYESGADKCLCCPFEIDCSEASK